MAADIHITDLRAPQLSAEQKAMLEATRSLKVELRPEAALEAARRESGLEDFGAQDFLPRLAVWLGAADEDRTLLPAARLSLFRSCVRALKNRLRLVELLRRHPQIHSEQIRRPIIVVGLPRSGTTHLLNLMAADTRLRSLPYWESLEPFPDPREQPAADGEDPRRARCRDAYAGQNAALPLLRAMHDMHPDHVHEEIELLEPDFGSYALEWIAHVPRWRDYYYEMDMKPRYAYLKTSLQALQWLRGPRRWVLKSPQHLEQLEALTHCFPDAVIAFTHRDPLQVIQSAITMLAYGDRMRRHPVAPDTLAKYWTERIERLLRACVRQRHLIPAERSVDVLFHEFMAAELPTVERIYRRAELPFDASAKRHLADYVKQNPRGRHGRLRYNLQRDFGIDPAALRERFSFYTERFPVPAE